MRISELLECAEQCPQVCTHVCMCVSEIVCVCACTLASYRVCAYFRIIGVGWRGRSTPAGCAGLWLGAGQCISERSLCVLLVQVWSCHVTVHCVHMDTRAGGRDVCCTAECASACAWEASAECASTALSVLLEPGAQPLTSLLS